jgi:hypothetical protein
MVGFEVLKLGRMLKKGYNTLTMKKEAMLANDPDCDMKEALVPD